jgi:hypothetical protein
MKIYRKITSLALVLTSSFQFFCSRKSDARASKSETSYTLRAPERPGPGLQSSNKENSEPKQTTPKKSDTLQNILSNLLNLLFHTVHPLFGALVWGKNSAAAANVGLLLHALLTLPAHILGYGLLFVICMTGGLDEIQRVLMSKYNAFLSPMEIAKSVVNVGSDVRDNYQRMAQNGLLDLKNQGYQVAIACSETRADDKNHLTASEIFLVRDFKAYKIKIKENTLEVSEPCSIPEAMPLICTKIFFPPISEGVSKLLSKYEGLGSRIMIPYDNRLPA